LPYVMRLTLCIKCVAGKPHTRQRLCKLLHSTALTYAITGKAYVSSTSGARELTLPLGKRLYLSFNFISIFTQPKKQEAMLPLALRQNLWLLATSEKSAF